MSKRNRTKDGKQKILYFLPEEMETLKKCATAVGLGNNLNKYIYKAIEEKNMEVLKRKGFEVNG